MRVFLYLLFLAASVAYGAKVGDTYDSVIAEKGVPKSQVQVGAVQMLGYPDVAIKLKDHVVVSIRAVVNTPPMPSPPPKAAKPQVPKPAISVEALRAQLQDAIDSVSAIVNQPVASVPRTQVIMRRCGLLPGGWFHDGASTPDYNNVDVRMTQETANYTKWEYDSSSLNPDVAFLGTDLEFNSMTKIFYQDRSLPKKKLTEDEMVEINRLYRIIGRCSEQLGHLGVSP